MFSLVSRSLSHIIFKKMHLYDTVNKFDCRIIGYRNYIKIDIEQQEEEEKEKELKVGGNVYEEKLRKTRKMKERKNEKEKRGRTRSKRKITSNVGISTNYNKK